MAARGRKQLSREAWLDEALRALDEGGLGGVKVLPLARRLGVSRGSFYWHFRDREDLLRSLLDYWDTELTDAVIERAAELRGDARERLWALMQEVVERRQGRYDPAVRAWALHAPVAAAVVRRVDRKRLSFLKRLFKEMGFGQEQAEARARLTLGFMVTDHVLLVEEPSPKRRKLLRLRHRVLTQP
jgi:AcrR family transcriptional regulator